MIKQILRLISFSELEERLRQVPLKGKDPSGNEILVYKDAKISLRKNVDPYEVNPTTFYLLREGVRNQEIIRDDLKAFGIDSFNLEGAVEILNDKNEIWTLTPPIVEVTPRVINYDPQVNEEKYVQSHKIQIPIINDGAHRVFVALKGNETLNMIWISGADPKYPFYAHPNNWEEVKIVDSVPKSKEEKKLYRLADCYHVYRDFGFIGCGAPRGLGK